ncbi:MAG: Gfo/Idh/MocA family oxidoreductase [Novosphingobium sp.]|nr:Gfo/Idh/MocA family oxidoreductase [Novosphingobium sp.]MCP5404316.1 Gfo/Idh/MocA family oxidoreductase [Novosphingobium sp.]
MKVIIIGAGFGKYAVAPVFEKLGAETEVVTPRDAAAVERAIASDADLVSIHSPPFMHHEHVMMALDRGHAVLCDKPFGLNAHQARDMRDTARAKGVLHFANLEMRNKPVRARILELVRGGAIGEPKHLSWTFISNGFRGGTHGWVHDKALGGGWINAYGSHLIDFMRCLFDSEVADCGGVARTEWLTRKDREGATQDATAEDAYSAWFLMENGCTVSHDTGYCAPVPLPSRVTVTGSEGAIEVINDTKLTVRSAVDVEGLSAEERIKRGLLPGEGDAVEDFTPAPGEAHEPSLMPWLAQVKQALETGTQIKPDFDDAVAMAEAMDMLRNNMVTA